MFGESVYLEKFKLQRILVRLVEYFIKLKRERLYFSYNASRKRFNNGYFNALILIALA